MKLFRKLKRKWIARKINKLIPKLILHENAYKITTDPAEKFKAACNYVKVADKIMELLGKDAPSNLFVKYLNMKAAFVGEVSNMIQQKKGE